MITKTYDELVFKLVPIEPTDAMKERGSNCAEYGHDDIYPESAADVYRAMLAAAPTPPAEQQPEYKRMFMAAVAQIAEISEALGIDSEDAACANGNDMILAAIEKKNASIMAWATRPAPTVAALRAKVEALPTFANCVDRDAVLAEIDKLGGGV